MFRWLALLLVTASILGTLLLLVQLAALALHRRRARILRPSTTPRVSILKPLCGLDDDLLDNLTAYAELPYPNYELLLGVETTSDPAYWTALAVAREWPGRVRVVVQRGAPGLNPKVNQLASLAAAATGELLVISDSNTRARPEFLGEIVALFEDPSVGLVAHPVVGAGEERVGAALDNLHLASIGLGCVASKLVAGKDLVVGKMMSLRKADVEALGGFAAVANVLAEDYVLGCLVPQTLGKRVVLASSVVQSFSRRRTVRAFYERYARWGVMQRMAVGNAVYLAQTMLNPLFLAAIAFLVLPSWNRALFVVSTALLRTLVDGTTGALLREEGFALKWLVWSPLKDLVMGAAWIHGLTHATVTWRGHALRVQPGTHLVPVDQDALAPELAASLQLAAVVSFDSNSRKR